MYCRHVREKAIPVDHIKVIYEHGRRILPAGQCISIHEDSKMGKFVYFEEHPNDSAVLESILQEETDRRHLLKSDSV